MEHYLEAFGNVPFVGVVTSALAMIAFSTLWYSPLLFGRALNRLSDKRLGDSHARISYVYAVIAALVNAYLLGLISVHATESSHALLGGVAMLWLFVMVEQANGFIWNREPFALFLLHAFRSLFSLLIGATIFLLWR